MKIFIFLLSTILVSTALADRGYYADADSFMDDLIKTSHQFASDLIASESKTNEQLKEREELEPQTTGGDSSASQEAVDNIETNHKEEEDDDDDDDDDDKVVMNIPPSIYHIPTKFPDFSDIFRLLTTTANKPWWKGEHVCTEKKLDESEDEEGKALTASGVFLLSGSATLTSCQNGPNTYVCTTVVHQNGKTTKSTVIHKCCKGHRLGPNGCSEVDSKPIDEVAKELDGGKFTEACKDEGITDLLEGEKTIFLPKDDAMATLDRENELKNSVLTNEIAVDGPERISKREILLNHIVPGVHDKSTFRNDLVLSTENNNTIRINGFPGGVVTANCNKLNKTDKWTKEGVIHVVDGIMQPPQKNLAELLSEPQYSKFKQMLDDANIDLSSDKGSFTVFAVNNDAFEGFEPNHAMCMEVILKHHILPHTVCSVAAENGRIFNIDSQGDWTTFENKDGEIMVDSKIKVTKPDIMATNGVLHEVHGFIVPSSARSAVDLLEKTNHTRFLALMDRAGLKNQIEKSQNITIFVPIEESLENLESIEDNEELKKALLNHVVQGKVDSEKILEGEPIKTLHGAELRVSAPKNLFTSVFSRPNPNVQCARLTRVDGSICNGIAHEVAKPLVTPSESIYDIIMNNPELEKFRKIVEKSELMEKLKERKNSVRHLTLLGVTNKGFEKLDPKDLELLESDQNLQDRFLRTHLISGGFCCNEIDTNSWPFLNPMRNLLGEMVLAERSGAQGGISFGDSKIDQCDITAKDGISHLISEPILSSKKLGGQKIMIKKPGSEIILAGF